MKYQTVLICAIILPAVLAITPQRHRVAELLIGDEANLIDPDCFAQVKNELMREIDDAVEKYVEKVENGQIIYKKGLHMNVSSFLDRTLLPSVLVHASEECIEHVKEVFKVILKNRYGDAIKAIDPDF
ncbi:uncharacterized protein LOC109612003 [Musca domestica]|uniref:Uncharacterized protein LOC109612003 n=1 Tax=Musca domestica TaxID=7370 RepID=A0A9J7DDG4_MUSDO|nr:uncharacterized protein LOC109612003 [Musca domestica]